ncbi:MAG: M16 family metallopeptidase [Planctomycetota bacterium]
MYVANETTIRNQTVREEIRFRTHDSGLPVYFCRKPGFQKRYACFATNYGSMDLRFRPGSGEIIEVPDGIAHFLEHKVFEREDGNALELFSRRGASCNAYTSFSVTNYLFSCNDHFFDNLDLLIEFVLTPYITDDNVEKEKGIIGQEIKMYDDKPGWRSFRNLLEVLYQRHPVRRDIAGTVDSIARIDRNALYECHRAFYQPNNMILFGIGDEAPEEFFDYADRSLSRFPQWRSQPLAVRDFPEEPTTVGREDITQFMEVSMPRLLLGIKDRVDHEPGPRLLAQELLTDILLEIVFGRGSSFYERLYERELVDDTFAVGYSRYREIGFSTLGGDSPDPDALASELVAEMERVRRDGVTREDFERQKRSGMGSFIRHFSSLEFTANNFCLYQFGGVNLFDAIDILHGLRFEDLTKRIEQHFQPSAVARSIIQPRASAAAP